MKKLIAELISAELPELSLEDIEKSIENPPKPELGDFAFPCFRLAKVMHKAPNLIAGELAEKIKSDAIDRIDVIDIIDAIDTVVTITFISSITLLYI